MDLSNYKVKMKRIAGENGTCWMSIENLKKRCGIGHERLKKSIKYLLEHKWIDFVGKKEVETRGGRQFVNEYRINDLWKMNVNFYEGGSPQEALPNKVQRGVVEGGSPQDVKKNHIKEEPNKEDITFEQWFDLEVKIPNNTYLPLLLEERKKFIEYWTAQNIGDKKMAWELAAAKNRNKKFYMKLRWNTWTRNVETRMKQPEFKKEPRSSGSGMSSIADYIKTKQN